MTTSTGLNQEQNLIPLNVPTPWGFPYKTEIRIHEDSQYVVKLNCWWDKDPRGDQHNHPWSFESYILSGGYTEDRNGTLVSYSEGEINRVMNWQFHNVIKVKPETVSLMICTKDNEDQDWGHLVGQGFVSAVNWASDNISRNVEKRDFVDRLILVNPMRYEDGHSRFNKPCEVALEVLEFYRESISEICKRKGLTISF